MGIYEEILEDIIEQAKERHELTYVMRDDGKEGFEYRMYCNDCDFQCHPSGCSYIDKERSNFDIREEKGKCYGFLEMDVFNDWIADHLVIDPDTGEYWER